MVKNKVEKLKDRLKTELGIEIPDTARFERQYPGHWQRSSGAWSWFFFPTTPTVGSQYSVTELLKAEKLYVFEHITGNQVSIDPHP